MWSLPVFLGLPDQVPSPQALPSLLWPPCLPMLSIHGFVSLSTAQGESRAWVLIGARSLGSDWSKVLALTKSSKSGNMLSSAPLNSTHCPLPLSSLAQGPGL